MPQQPSVRIATRKSPLALWQAEYVGGLIRRTAPGIRVERVEMSTRGDKILDSPLAKVGGKGLFVKELEEGLIGGTADIAVHSMKDVPVELPRDLHLGAILKRHDPRDAYVSNHFPTPDKLAMHARIGTSSLRRRCQLLELFPNAQILNLRGNVNTRLKKLDAGDYDAIILAVAGLERLGYDDRIALRLPMEMSLPAIGQGAIGVECKKNDERINAIVAALGDVETTLCVLAERAMNKRLQGGCQVPIAGFAKLEPSGDLVLKGLVGKPDGSHIIRGEIKGPKDQTEVLGERLADDLLSRGAGEILSDLYEL